MNAIIKATGEVIPVTPKNGTDFQLPELKEIVNGWIEIVYLQDNEQHMMVVNEEGKLMNLPFNKKATYLYINHTGCKDAIVGDVLVCEKGSIL